MTSITISQKDDDPYSAEKPEFLLLDQEDADKEYLLQKPKHECMLQAPKED